VTVGDRVVDSLGAGFQDRAGPLLDPLVEAFTDELNDVETVVGGEHGWVDQFDLTVTPYPGWLGQLAGVTDAAGTVEQQRLAVQGRGSSRGTVAAIRAAVQATLTGTKRVTITERADGAYRIEVITYAPETPDTARTLAAVLSAKPAGLLLTYDAPLGQTWRDLNSTGQTWQQVKDSGLTWDQLRRVVPSA
jgi:hypothetical protein